MDEQPVSRQALWARQKKAQLLAQLGGVCRICGCRDNLTFDCIVPCGGEHHKAGSAGRVSFYISQMRRGNIQVLCHFCNSRKQDKAQSRYVPVPLADSGQPSQFDVWP
jgi:hypothetical protein